MNRLTLIGNGFDIAHGLNTRYSDFLRFYWKNVKNNYHKDDFIEFYNNNFSNPSVSLCKDSFDEISKMFRFKSALNFKAVNYFNDLYDFKLNFKNTLFHYLNLKGQKNFDWVDFEESYYKLLLTVRNEEQKSQFNIASLNKDLKQIAIRFEKYLISEVEPIIQNVKYSEMEELFLPRILSNDNKILNFLNEFPLKRHIEIRENLVQNKKSKIITHYAFNDSLVLNFNYTKTPLLYVDKSQIINIHGSLNDELNPILLGFGDEKDKFYSEIEDLNDNDYLEFMKSTYYSKTSNYKRLFDFLDSDVFQVQILGHSCGLSDRTLLNSIFQHENCHSIKVYYHKFENPDSNGEVDNFTQITRNISRHFTNKVMMRERIVNKEYCTPLPQKVND